MPRRDESGFVGFCISLVIHAMLALLIVRFYILDEDSLLHFQPHHKSTSGQGAFSFPFDPPASEAPKPTPHLPTPPPPHPHTTPPPPNEFISRDSDFGESNGKGEALNSFKADEDFQGRQGPQDQAFLSLDPVGPGRLPPVPSPFTALPGQNGDNRPMRPVGPGGDGAGSPLAAALTPAMAAPTPFGANAGGAPPIIIAPKLVAPPPTPPPPPPVATVPPVRVEPQAIAIVEPGNAGKRPVDAQSTKRAIDSLPEDLPPGPEMTLRPKIKPPTTQPNDTVVEVPLSEKTLKGSPSTRPTQIAVDDKIHPDSPKPSPTSQPADLVAANAEPSDKSTPAPTTRPIETAQIDANPKRPNPEKAIQDLLKRPPTTMPAEDVALAPTTQPAPTPGLKPGQPETALATFIPHDQSISPNLSPSKPARPEAKNPGPGGAPDSGGGRAGPPIAPADPAPMADQESDAFSTKGTIVMKAGKIDARLGRKVKPIKPRLNLSGELDVYDHFNATVIFSVAVDPTGKVTDVKTLKSSGSNAIDHPTELALYQWWIEPTKNKAGKPIKDTLVLTIAFR